MKDDWEEVTELLPEGWKEKAKELGALKRRRNIKNPEDLLAMNLLYASEGGSYQATSTLMKMSAGISLDKNAVYGRILSSAEWLKWLAEGVCREKGMVSEKPSFLQEHNVVLCDASELSIKGSAGGDYYLHFAFDLFRFACRDVLFTSIKEGEKLSLHSVKPGDIYIGDRAYGTISGMEYVREHEGDFIVRLKHKAFTLYDEKGNAVHINDALRQGTEGTYIDIPCYYRAEKREENHVVKEMRPVRILGIRKDLTSIERTQKRLHRRASRCQCKTVSPEAAFANQYIVVATSLPYTPEQIIELYRARWQIELVFLRLKVLMGMGEIPNKKPESVRAWFYAKLLFAALCEAQICARTHFPPEPISADDQKRLE